MKVAGQGRVTSTIFIQNVMMCVIFKLKKQQTAFKIAIHSSILPIQSSVVRCINSIYIVYSKFNKIYAVSSNSVGIVSHDVGMVYAIIVSRSMGLLILKEKLLKLKVADACGLVSR